MLRSVITAALVAVACTSTALAQSRVGLELRGGAGLPTQDFGETALKTGVGAELTVNYQIMPHVRTYVGWDWHQFMTDETFLGDDYHVVDTGYAFGVQFKHPLASNLGGWVRAGGMFNHVEMENDFGGIMGDTGHELGWEAGGGLSIALSPKLELMPGVRFRTFSTDIEIEQTKVPVDLSYVAVEVGLSWTFGVPQVLTALKR